MAQFFVGWEVLRTKVVEKIKTHFMFRSIFFFSEICAVLDYVEECRRGRQATENNVILRVRVACWIIKTADTHNITEE